MNLVDFYKRFPSELECIQYLEEIRWNGKIVCPRCDSDRVYKFSSGKLLKCGACRKQFTVRIGTIFEDSRLPLQKWFLAIYLHTSLKKGISSIQIGKYLGITQKSAWFVLQRIRYAVSTQSYNKPLSGIVEVDETFFGANGKNRAYEWGASKKKEVIMGMVERKGRAYLKHVPNTLKATLVNQIKENVDPKAHVMTDELPAYKNLYTEGYFKHYSVNHSYKEYVRKHLFHTNSIEGVWSHLKRGIKGIYIHVSKKHLAKYCDEYSFRFNFREITDAQRFDVWFGYCVDKRLTYKSLIG